MIELTKDSNMTSTAGDTGENYNRERDLIAESVYMDGSDKFYEANDNMQALEIKQKTSGSQSNKKEFSEV